LSKRKAGACCIDARFSTLGLWAQGAGGRDNCHALRIFNTKKEVAADLIFAVNQKKEVKIMYKNTVTKLTLVCFSLIIAGLMFSSPGYTEIVGHWRFDEGEGDIAKDSSGKGNDGEIVGAVWADGVKGKCLQFDGVDDYVDCGNDPSLDPPHVTLAMWVWFDHIPYEHDIALNKEGKYRLIAGDFDTTHVSIRYQTANTAWGPGTLAGDTELEAGKWYHVAATYDGEKWSLYLDGKPNGEKAESGDLVSNENPLYIGQYSPPTGWPFTGFLDEVLIANTALSAVEISGLTTAVSPAGKISTCWGTIKSQ